MYTPPASTTDNLALLRQQFAAKSADIDVLMIDVVWPGVIKDHLVDLKKYSKGAESKHFPAIVANNTVDGKLLGMPFFTDAGACCSTARTCSRSTAPRCPRPGTNSPPRRRR